MPIRHKKTQAGDLGNFRVINALNFLSYGKAKRKEHQCVQENP